MEATGGKEEELHRCDRQVRGHMTYSTLSSDACRLFSDWSKPLSCSSSLQTLLRDGQERKRDGRARDRSCGETGEDKWRDGCQSKEEESDRQVGMQQHMQWFPWKQTGKNTWRMLVWVTSSSVWHQRWRAELHVAVQTIRTSRTRRAALIGCFQLSMTQPVPIGSICCTTLRSKIRSTQHSIWTLVWFWVIGLDWWFWLWVGSPVRLLGPVLGPLQFSLHHHQLASDL